MTADSPLTPGQTRAIGAILVTPTYGEAATAARVGERSLRRWLTLPAFRSALARARTRLLDEAVTTLVKGATRAAASLVSMAVTETRATPVRVAAARAVLDLALRATELGDIVARIEVLEAETAGRPGGRGVVQTRVATHKGFSNDHE